MIEYETTMSGTGTLTTQLTGCAEGPINRSPNILLAISDDQSWPHASAYGCPFLRTPAFDRIAREGVLFDNAFAPAPQCSPTRASILTGNNPWQNGDAAVHGTAIPSKIPLYTFLLESAGYHVGKTGKGWAPGPPEIVTSNPAGKEYMLSDEKRTEHRYTDSFRAFLEARRPGQPFCFWYGSKEPHRGYRKGSGLEAGKTLESVCVPEFLPDHPDIRSDMLDYAVEIETFDTQLDQMLTILEEMDELDNTLIVVTSDNGMPWTRAKANLYEYGVHMPLAVRWGTQVPPERTVTDLVSLIDLAPTFLDAAGVAIPDGIAGRSLLDILQSKRSGQVDESRASVLVGRERHGPYVRENDAGYPSRGIRTYQYLYIRNLKPDRWPEGDTFYDGGPSSSRDLYITECKNPALHPFIRLAWSKRPAEELFDIQVDPYCLRNLAHETAYTNVREKLWDRLQTALIEQGDPRLHGDDHYDDLEYFKAPFWKELRLEHLKEVEGVHRVMGAVGW